MPALDSRTLSELPDGASAVVAGVTARAAEVDAATLRRLQELGFVDGEPVTVMRRGPGGREPIAVRVGDTLFALRRVEAQCIDVRPA